MRTPRSISEEFRDHQLASEHLEERCLLSTVQVFAAGTNGDETFDLIIDDSVVSSFVVESTEFAAFVFESADPVEIGQVRIQFANDFYDPANGIDRNLIVDRVVVDGTTYQTEHASTFSTGNWQDEFGAAIPGYHTSEWLQVNGFLQFEEQGGTSIQVFARGSTGQEIMRLSIRGGQPIAEWNVATTTESYSIDINEVLDVGSDTIRIEFLNDLYDPDNGIDQDLIVDRIEINGVAYQAEAASTYSTGTWRTDLGIEPGFVTQETLHTNGFFQFQAISNGIDNFTYEIASNNGSQAPGVANVQITVNASHQQPQSLINPAVASELTPSGTALIVTKVAKLPRGDNGRQPRMNSMARFGNRVFIVTDGAIDGEGKIFELVTDDQGNTSVELFFDVGPAILANTGHDIDNSSPLNGLRSLAFHPEFATNGKFFTSYTGIRPAVSRGTVYLSDPVTPVNVESVLVEWTFDIANNQVDLASYREVFRVGMRNTEHSIRGLSFDPFAQPGDENYGLLFIGHGDGSEQSAISGDGQGNDALGKILRIDPLQTADTPFTVPVSNPFVGVSDFPDAVYALGFRNPHNLTFAQDATGISHLIVTEIGRDNVEEIDIVVKGQNYGWADREGIFVHLRDQFDINGNIANLPVNDAENDLVYPVSIFGHDGIPGESFVGQAIAGGHVIQNGSSDLDDQFVFLEFATDGRAYHIDFSEMLQQVTTLDINDPNRDSPDDLTWLTPQELTILFDHDGDESTTPLIRESLKDVLNDEPDFELVPSAGKIRADLRLGQGPNGELYILNKRNGWVYVATNTVIADAG